MFNNVDKDMVNIFGVFGVLVVLYGIAMLVM